MAQAKLEFSGDAQKLLTEMAKVQQKQGDMIQKLKEGNRESKRGTKDHADGLGGVATKLGSVVAGYLSIGVAIGTIRSGMHAWSQYMDEVTQKANQAAQDMAALALLQQPGQMRQNVLQAQAMGINYGVTGGQSWAVTQAFQSKYGGDFAKGLGAAEATFALAQAGGVPVEGARTAVAVGTGLGLSPADAARAAYAAGAASQLSAAELASMAGSGLPAYQGVGGGALTGYGVAAALSGLISDPGNLGTYTRQVGTLMQTRTGKVGETWKGLGIATPGADIEAQLLAMHGAGIRTMGDLQAAGFAKKESLGLSILLADLPAALETMKDVRTAFADTDLLPRQRAAAEAEIPEMALQRRTAQATAAIEAMETLGPTAQYAQRRKLAQLYLQMRGIEEGAHPWRRRFLGGVKFDAMEALGWTPEEIAASGGALLGGRGGLLDPESRDNERARLREFMGEGPLPVRLVNDPNRDHMPAPRAVGD